jgi:thiamine biosynthesis lipoprotein
LVEVALAAAETTGGCVDPTLGGPLRAAGYDRTFSVVRERDSWAFAERRVPPEQWRQVELDVGRLTLRAPRGVELDLGATAKAWASDHAARTSCGVLVSLGGDIAVAGGSAGRSGSPDHRNPRRPIVSIASGGLATSARPDRHWRTDVGEAITCLILTGRLRKAAGGRERCGATCLDANVAATAASCCHAAAWLEDRQLLARLVGASRSARRRLACDQVAA